MAGQLKRTIKHDLIRAWAEKRAGVPALVRTSNDALKIKLGSDEASYEPIEWSKWFEIFDEKEQAFVFEDPGYMSKIVRRNGKEDQAPPSSDKTQT